MKKNKIFVLIILLIGFATIWIYLNSSAESIECANCNIVLISIDTVRADHLGYMGYYRNTSPNIDKFASESLDFREAYVQSTWTLPSHMSIFTSLNPSVHKVDEENKSKSSGIYLLTKNLQGKMETAAFVDHYYVSSEYGFNESFDFFDEKGAYETHIYKDTKVVGGIKNLNPRIFNWLEANKDKQFFLFLHYFDVHPPYDPPKQLVDTFYPNYTGNLSLYGKLGEDLDSANLTQQDKDYVIAAYDANVRYVDSYLGDLFDKFDELNLTGKTIIILLSDHGQELWENGYTGHAGYFDDAVIHVPLLIKHPLLKPRAINNQVRLIDVFPTIFDFLKISNSQQVQGLSLTQIILGREANERSVFVETGNVYAIRENGYKLVLNNDTGEELFYNLSNGERKVDAQQVSIATKLRNDLQNYLQQNQEKANQLGVRVVYRSEPIEKSVLEKLKKLGYAS